MTVTLAIAVLAGCSSVLDQEPPSPGGASKSELVKVRAEYDVLAKLPNIDQATVRYDKMLTALLDALGTEFRYGKWEQLLGGGQGFCGEWVINYDLSKEWNSPLWKNDPLSEAEWPKAVAILNRFTGPLGFTRGPSLHDEPGHHDVRLMDPQGATMSFTNGTRFVVALSSGCHLLPGAVRPTS